MELNNTTIDFETSLNHLLTCTIITIFELLFPKRQERALLNAPHLFSFDNTRRKRQMKERLKNEFNKILENC